MNSFYRVRPSDVRLPLVGLVAAVMSFWAGLVHGITQSPQEIDLAERIAAHPAQMRAAMTNHPILNLVARAKARDMAARGYFSHVDPDGFGANYAVKLADYGLPEAWGDARDANQIESLAGGQATAQAVLAAWLSSPAHVDHVLATHPFFRDQTSYGVGYANVPGSAYTHYWVLLTAPPDDEAFLKPYLEWQFLHQTVAKTDDCMLGDGWVWLSWFGLFNETGFPNIRHGTLGPMTWDGESIADLRLVTPDMGVLKTGDQIFPFLYREQDAAWLLYIRGTSKPRLFLNLTARKWEKR